VWPVPGWSTRALPRGARFVLGRRDDSTVAVPVTGQRWPPLDDILPGPVGDVIATVTGICPWVLTSGDEPRVQRLELDNEEEKTVARSTWTNRPPRPRPSSRPRRFARPRRSVTTSGSSAGRS